MYAIFGPRYDDGGRVGLDDRVCLVTSPVTNRHSLATRWPRPCNSDVRRCPYSIVHEGLYEERTCCKAKSRTVHTPALEGRGMLKKRSFSKHVPPTRSIKISRFFASKKLLFSIKKLMCGRTFTLVYSCTIERRHRAREETTGTSTRFTY